MNEVQFKLDLRLVCAVLLAVIAVITYLWKPWQSPTVRTVTVTGEASIDQAPDQYVFSPSFTTTNSDRAVALKQVTDTGNAVVAKLKSLGVKDSEISTTVNSNSAGYPEPMSSSVSSGGAMSPVGSQNTATYDITITLGDKTLAQAVMDYLATTTAAGSITPESTFTTATTSNLETKVRTKAVADARQKADAEAAQLGAKVTKVQSVTDEAANTILPMTSGPKSATASGATSSSTPLLTGAQTVSIQLTAIFVIR